MTKTYNLNPIIFFLFCFTTFIQLIYIDVLFINRGGARRKVSLAVYNEDDSNDLSDLGIGTSSASGKSSLSEDFDNHSVIVSCFCLSLNLNLNFIGSCFYVLISLLFLII